MHKPEKSTNHQLQPNQRSNSSGPETPQTTPSQIHPGKGSLFNHDLWTDEDTNCNTTPDKDPEIIQRAITAKIGVA